MLGSLGFRAKAFAFKGNKLDPIAGTKRILGKQGLIELGKSIAKVLVLGAVGIWFLLGQTPAMIGLTAQDMRPALANVGNSFIIAVLVMGGALALIALIDVPAQLYQRTQRLKMSMQELKEENKADRRVARAQGRRPPPPARGGAQFGAQGDLGSDRRADQSDPFRGGAALSPRRGRRPARPGQGPRRDRRGDPRARRRA